MMEIFVLYCSYFHVMYPPEIGDFVYITDHAYTESPRPVYKCFNYFKVTFFPWNRN